MNDPKSKTQSDATIRALIKGQEIIHRYEEVDEILVDMRDIRFFNLFPFPVPQQVSLIQGDGPNGEIVIYEPIAGGGRVGVKLYQFDDFITGFNGVVPRLVSVDAGTSDEAPDSYDTQYIQTKGLTLSPNMLEDCRYHPTATVTKKIRTGPNARQEYTFRHQLCYPMRSASDPGALDRPTIRDEACVTPGDPFCVTSGLIGFYDGIWYLNYSDTPSKNTYYIKKEIDSGTQCRNANEPGYIFLASYDECP